MRRQLLDIGHVAGWTMVSRILGLVRDVLLFAALGTGAVNSAFILAFTIPNLFRRLLGEGALNSAMIPVFTRIMEEYGDAAAYRLLNAVLSRLLVATLGLAGLLLVAALLLQGLAQPGDRWEIGGRLSAWLSPYLVLICLSAIVCGVLQVRGRFRLAAATQVWLNLSMILAGLWALSSFSGEIPEQVVNGFVVAVLVGGLLQLLIPACGLRREGWSPALFPGKAEGLEAVIKLFLPGLFGAAIFQINILVGRLFAFWLNDEAAGLLYLASRMIELPLGVFAVAISTVLFPELSRFSGRGESTGFADCYRRGSRIIFLITLPAMLGLILLAGPIVRFLFEWGRFGAESVQMAVPVLQVSALGLPAFALSGLLVRAYYARESIRIPVRLALVNLILNSALSLVLMHLLGVVGLALANVLSGFVHTVLLRLYLGIEGGFRAEGLLPLVSANAFLGLVAFGLQRLIGELGLTKGGEGLVLLGGIFLIAGSYFAFLHWLGNEDMRELTKRLNSHGRT